MMAISHNTDEDSHAQTKRSVNSSFYFTRVTQILVAWRAEQKPDGLRHRDAKHAFLSPT